MERIRDITLLLNIIGGSEKFIEIIHAAYMHQKQLALEKEQEAAEWKEKHDALEEKHTRLLEEHEQLKQANPSLDTHKDVLV